MFVILNGTIERGTESINFPNVQVLRGEDSGHMMSIMKNLINLGPGFRKSSEAVMSMLGSHDQVRPSLPHFLFSVVSFGPLHFILFFTPDTVTIKVSRDFLQEETRQ
jgi:hypothetical protein